MCICSNRVCGLIVHTYQRQLYGALSTSSPFFTFAWSIPMLSWSGFDLCHGSGCGFPSSPAWCKETCHISGDTCGRSVEGWSAMEGKHGQMEGSWQDGHSLEIFAHQCVVNSEMILWHSLRLQVMLASILQVNSLYHLYPFVTKSRC